jgi:hypothetical protein
MINRTISNEIVKQRAQGLSFDAISEITHVSKPTVIQICGRRDGDVEEAAEIASVLSRGEVAIAINVRRKDYTRLIYRAIDELNQRDLSQMSTAGIVKLITGIEKTLGNLEMKHAEEVDFKQMNVIVEFARGYLAQLEADAAL